MASILNVDQINNAAGTSAITIDSSGNTLMPGHVVQVVNTTWATQVSTNGSTYVDTGFDASITPISASNKILILGCFSIYLAGGTTNNLGHVAIYKDDTTKLADAVIRQYDYGGSGVLVNRPISLNYYDSPATTSAVKYTLYFRLDSGATIVLNDNNESLSTFTLMEIAQ